MSVTPSVALTIAELRRLLTRAEPAALLVSPRILRRVIKKDRGLGGPGLQVPHRKSYVIERDRLLRLADGDELDVEPGRDLPPVLLLFPRPDEPRLARSSREATLLKYWRLLFHARVHLALQARALTDADLRDRIRRIGITEFDEATAVLRQEHFVLPPADARTLYEEFAAVYLELRSFAPHRLPVYFPTCAHLETIDATLALDVDAAGLFAATRLEGAADPAQAALVPMDDEGERGRVSAPSAPLGALTRPRSPDAPQTYRRLLERADQRQRARQHGPRRRLPHASGSPGAARPGRYHPRRCPARDRAIQPALAEGPRLQRRGRRRVAAGASHPARTGGRAASGRARAACSTICKPSASIRSVLFTPWTSSNGLSPGADGRSNACCPFMVRC